MVLVPRLLVPRSSVFSLGQRAPFIVFAAGGFAASATCAFRHSSKTTAMASNVRDRFARGSGSLAGSFECVVITVRVVFVLARPLFFFFFFLHLPLSLRERNRKRTTGWQPSRKRFGGLCLCPSEGVKLHQNIRQIWQSQNTSLASPR